MSRAIPRLLAFVPAALLVPSSLLRAQEREFTQSRDWHLPPRGEHELELRSFFDTSHGDQRVQLEYEYGVTDYFTFEPGIEIEEDENDDFEVSALDIELRFHFGEYHQDAWLPALTVELERPFDDAEANELELMGVLSRYGERDDFTVNVDWAKELEDERESESKLTAGWAHALDPMDARRWKVGLELVEDFEAHDLRAGPLTSWRASSHLQLLASYVFAIDDRGDDNFDELAFLMEFEL